MGFDYNQSQIIEKLRRHWDNKLRENKHAPKNARTKYPLAPKDMVMDKLVTVDNYGCENTAFGTFCSSMMEAELVGISSEKIRLATVEILGAGLSRDLDWVKNAALKCSVVNIRDVSSVACEIASKYFKDLVDIERVNVLCDEIEIVLNHKEMDGDEPVIYFGSQFIQVQDKRTMRRMMKKFGTILDNPMSGTNPVRLMYLMHPYEVDNNTPRDYGYYKLREVVWGDTTPYSEAELCLALQKGSSRRVKVTVLGKHDYFHQRYSLLKFEVDKS